MWEESATCGRSPLVEVNLVNLKLTQLRLTCEEGGSGSEPYLGAGVGGGVRMQRLAFSVTAAQR